MSEPETNGWSKYEKLVVDKLSSLEESQKTFQVDVRKEIRGLHDKIEASSAITKKELFDRINDINKTQTDSTTSVKDLLTQSMNEFKLVVTEKLAILNVKSGIWGMIGGALPFVAIIIVYVIKNW